MEDQSDLIEMTAGIVSAYVGNNVVAPVDLPALIQQVHSALRHRRRSAGREPAPAPKEPAVPLKKSISPDFLICLEDGRKFKSLKRHLRTKYDMSPEEYRAKWNLPKDYPMVAPNYAKARSDLAKQMGLGQGGRKPLAQRRNSRVGSKAWPFQAARKFSSARRPDTGDGRFRLLVDS
jgi:predicted transcriptional regulator